MISPFYKWFEFEFSLKAICPITTGYGAMKSLENFCTKFDKNLNVCVSLFNIFNIFISVKTFKSSLRRKQAQEVVCLFKLSVASECSEWESWYNKQAIQSYRVITNKQQSN